MTKNEAMKLALEWFQCFQDKSMSRNNAEALADEVIDALQKALAEQPAQKRPQNCGTGYCSCIECVMEPAQRTWVGLTDEEVWDLWNSYTEEPFPEWFVDFKRSYKVLEAKLKELNI